MTDTPTTTDPATEFAPSVVAADEPTAARVAGLSGLMLVVLGLAAVIANQYGDRFISAPLGYLFAAAGLLGMLFHAARDGEQESRRLYLGFGMLTLLAAVVAGFVPGPLFGGEGVTRAAGYHFLPWTPALAVVALAFLLVPFRHETDPQVRNIGLTVLFTVGAVLTVGSVAFGVARPETLAGPGVLLALVGLGFVTGFLMQLDTSDGPGYLVAVLLGVVGGAAIAYAVGRAAFPGVLIEGSGALKTAYQTYDGWKVAARIVTILGFLAFGGWALTWKSAPPWLRFGTAALGVAFAGVFVVGALATQPLIGSRPPFLVPGGLLLAGIGLLYLLVAVGIASDHPLVVVTRRELTGLFASPVAYVVLFIMAVVQFIGYWLFVIRLVDPGRAGSPVPEPILADYLPGTLLGPLAAMFLVPALTMRMYSEEKRSGALEVLLTAPVNETPIVLGKLAAGWLFYMLAWAPMGLYLIGLKVEGRAGFDYKPLLSLYVAVGVSGLAFVAVGGFLSSLTNSQVVAGMLTFGWMLGLFALNWHSYFSAQVPVLKGALDAAATASYWRLWDGSLKGQLPVRDLLVQASVAVFFVYLTVKSLESRKWS